MYVVVNVCDVDLWLLYKSVFFHGLSLYLKRINGLRSFLSCLLAFLRHTCFASHLFIWKWRSSIFVEGPSSALLAFVLLSASALYSVCSPSLSSFFPFQNRANLLPPTAMCPDKRASQKANIKNPT